MPQSPRGTDPGARFSMGTGGAAKGGARPMPQRSPETSLGGASRDRHQADRRAALTKESDVFKIAGLTEPETGIRLPFIQPESGRGFPSAPESARKSLVVAPDDGWRSPFRPEAGRG